MAKKQIKTWACPRCQSENVYIKVSAQAKALIGDGGLELMSFSEYESSRKPFTKRSPAFCEDCRLPGVVETFMHEDLTKGPLL